MPAAKLDLSAAATAARSAGGTEEIACATLPWRMALTIRGADPASDGGRAVDRWRSIAEVKMVPSAAMPVAMPTCRKVELAPEAIPAWCGGTTPIAVEASGGFTSPEPNPETMNPGIRCVHDDVPLRPVMRISPMPTTSRPGPTSQRAGTRSLSRPAIVAVTSWARLMTASRSPASSAE